MIETDECTREKAMEIAIKYLGTQHEGSLEIDNTLPTTACIYGVERLKNSWVINIPSWTPHVGEGRIICISKKTGEITYDGSDGGE